MPSKVWEVMNDLEMVTSKICSAREIIDAAVDRIQEHQYDKAEMMMSAAYEFLEYYLQEFDAKFKLAWQETVVKQKKEEDDAWDAVNKEKEYYEPSMPPWGHSDLEYMIKNNVPDLQESNYYSNVMPSATQRDIDREKPLSCDKDDSSPECKGAWNSFWEENYYPEEHQQYTEEELNAMCDKAASDEEKELCKEYNIREQEYIEPFTTDIGSVVRNGVSHIEYVKAKIEATSAWNDGWTKEHYQKIVDKYEGKRKWVLPIEQVHDDYFVSFPDDLLKTADLKEGDVVEWIDQGDGSFKLVKKELQASWVKGSELAKTKTYDEMIADGWEMTDDGFWILVKGDEC